MKVKPNDPSKCRLSVYLYSPDKKCIRRRNHLKNYCADKSIDLHIFDSVRFFYNPSLMISAKKTNDLKQIKDWNHNETRKIDEIPNYDNMVEKPYSINECPFEEFAPFIEESNLAESSIAKYPIIEEHALEKYSNESTIRESIIGESSFDGIDSLIDEFTIEDSSTFEKSPVDESSSSILELNFEKSNKEKSIIEESAIIRESIFKESTIDEDFSLETSSNDNNSKTTIINDNETIVVNEDGHSGVIYFGYWKPFPKKFKEFLKLEAEREEKIKLEMQKKENQYIYTNSITNAKVSAKINPPSSSNNFSTNSFNNNNAVYSKITILGKSENCTKNRTYLKPRDPGIAETNTVSLLLNQKPKICDKKIKSDYVIPSFLNDGSKEAVLTRLAPTQGLDTIYGIIEHRLTTGAFDDFKPPIMISENSRFKGDTPFENFRYYV